MKTKTPDEAQAALDVIEKRLGGYSNAKETLRTFINQSKTMDGERKRAERINEISSIIVDTLDGKSPMSKWMTNQHVKTLDDLEWWAQTQLKEVMILKGVKEFEGEDLTDWLDGKSSILDQLVQNIHAVKKAALSQPDDVGELADAFKTFISCVEYGTGDFRRTDYGSSALNKARKALSKHTEKSP